MLAAPKDTFPSLQRNLVRRRSGIILSIENCCRDNDGNIFQRVSDHNMASMVNDFELNIILTVQTQRKRVQKWAIPGILFFILVLTLSIQKTLTAHDWI